MPTAPFTNYVGPGNPLRNGLPQGPTDRSAQKHDWYYQAYIDAGINPYNTWNKADDIFVREVGADSNPELISAISQGAFLAKYTAFRAGSIGRADDTVVNFPAVDAARVRYNLSIGTYGRYRCKICVYVSKSCMAS